MAKDDRQRHREHPVGQAEIGMTEAAMRDADPDLAGSRFDYLDIVTNDERASLFFE